MQTLVYSLVFVRLSLASIQVSFVAFSLHVPLLMNFLSIPTLFLFWGRIYSGPIARFMFFPGQLFLVEAASNFGGGYAIPMSKFDCSTNFSPDEYLLTEKAHMPVTLVLSRSLYHECGTTTSISQ